MSLTEHRVEVSNNIHDQYLNWIKFDGFVLFCFFYLGRENINPLVETCYMGRTHTKIERHGNLVLNKTVL